MTTKYCEVGWRSFDRKIVYILLALVLIFLTASIVPASKGKRNTYADFKVSTVLQANKCTKWSKEDSELLYSIYGEVDKSNKPINTDIKDWLIDNATTRCGSMPIRYEP